MLLPLRIQPAAMRHQQGFSGFSIIQHTAGHLQGKARRAWSDTFACPPEVSQESRSAESDGRFWREIGGFGGHRRCGRRSGCWRIGEEDEEGEEEAELAEGEELGPRQAATRPSPQPQALHGLR